MLAYYIASVNIENVYHDLMAADVRGGLTYTAFPGICLTDTFQLGEQMYADSKPKQVEIEGMETPFVENSKRVENQLKSKITVVVGNPPYSAGQKSANDNAQNQHYPLLESKIEKSYVETSEASLNKSAYDSYIKAFRFATDRIGDEGIVAYVSNGSWLDTNAFDGFRKNIEQEFAEIYVFNLRGNARTQGELRRKEAGNVFGGGSRTPVSITLLIKRPHEGKAIIHYHDIGDYLSREQKLDIIRKTHCISALQMDILHPNEHGDWLNLRNDNFSTYFSLEPKKKYDAGQKSFFTTQTCGVATSRDCWCYNSDKTSLGKNIQKSIEFYNSEVTRISGNAGVELIMDDKLFSWDRQNKKDVVNGKSYSYDKNSLRVASYRPFMLQWMYINRQLNNCVYQVPHFFPNETLGNIVICVPGIGVTKEFSCIVSSQIPDHELIGKAQCFPLYWYEKRTGGQTDLFAGEQNDYIRHDALTDFILKRAREQYGGKVQKEDIFYYVYGFLHCPTYRETFANDLKKMLPRIPLVEKAEDFWAFSHAGRELTDLHLNYEQVEASKEVVIDMHNLLPGMEAESQEQLYRVTQMKFGKLGKDKDKSVIEYNPFITLRNIPLRAYDYVVNGKSAIEWIMERYCDKVDSKSGIRNDANQWGIEHGNPKYPLELLQSIITLSIKTLDIVDGLPRIVFV